MKSKEIVGLGLLVGSGMFVLGGCADRPEHSAAPVTTYERPIPLSPTTSTSTTVPETTTTLPWVTTTSSTPESTTTTSEPIMASTTTSTEVVFTPTTVKETARPAAILPQVDIGTLPSVLPVADSTQERYAMAVHTYNIPEGYKQNYKNCLDDTACDLTGSGVELKDNIYLAAGHLIDQANSQPLPNATTCNNILVDTQSTTPNTLSGKTSASPNNSGQRDAAVSEYGTYIKGDKSAVPDLAVIYAPNTAGNSLPSPTIPLATVAAKIGQSLFAVTYQNTPNGLSRDPYAKFFTTPEARTNGANAFNNGFGDPETVGEVPIDILSNGDIVVLDLKGYGPSPDEDSAIDRAASGAPVFNSVGQLAGIVVDKLLDGPAPTLQQVGRQLGIKFIGEPGSLPANLSLIQPVNAALVAAYTKKAMQAAHCSV